ncbi:DUF3862 domain-containing protein [Companilactobacillus crustorum]|uniref:DUF3862 domain-containing protein n=1 Tax=Companilactobacillus crustorum TaxID=392416 RepID=UPI000957AB81|nr:DUF3862 domain-containing protein [Companilactobacillus crustorum]APU71420.1 hypothetical protein BI355_1101 [Companilactobacillus crustorum]WDT66552.1 DUF3862 domain-containing protein [Companilactobacillus crustorum]HCD07950.1 DUF3862 domain-containing protein [Lactobacillus sp.]
MYNGNLPTRAEYRRSHKTLKKHFYKRWWFWTIIIILLLAGGGILGMQMTSTGPFTQTEKQTTKKKPKTKKKATTKTGVTLAQYKGIFLDQNSGTPSATVERLLGKPSATSTTTSQDSKTELDTWNKIQNGQLGSNLKVTFASGHAINKAITGIKVKRSKTLGMDEYSSVQNGQSEAVIMANLGQPNGYRESIVDGKNVVELTYSSGVSGASGANFIVNLTDGSVSGKSQTGMK